MIDGLLFWLPSAHWTADKVTAVGTLGLFLVTAALCWVTWSLVKGAEKASEQQLRAYIGVHQTGYSGLEDRNRFSVQFSFINHGQTPARQFNFNRVVDLAPFPLPPKFEFEEIPIRPLQDGVIFPKEDNPLKGWIHERENLNCSLEHKEKVLRSELGQTFYAHGFVTYVDIFGEKRETRFCLYLNQASIRRRLSAFENGISTGNLDFDWAPMEGRNHLT